MTPTIFWIGIGIVILVALVVGTEWRIKHVKDSNRID